MDAPLPGVNPVSASEGGGYSRRSLDGGASPFDKHLKNQTQFKLRISVHLLVVLPRNHFSKAFL